jgi:SAM-dependent methyltransferase
MSRWSERDDVARGAEYDQRWKAMAAAGESIHGEADWIDAVLTAEGRGEGVAILDAGCGTGRVAIELDRRGHQVIGVDLDEPMLAEAQAKAPGIQWVLADLLDVALDETFDMIALPGNVMIFVAPGTEGAVVTNLARHLRSDGLFLAGFQTGAGRLVLDDYDAHCAAAGLILVDRWSTWNGAPYADGDYAVSLHRRRSTVR